MDAGGAGFLAAALGVALAGAAILAVPDANARNEETSWGSTSDARPGAFAGEHSNSTNLDKKFKGKLPITQLTEDDQLKTNLFTDGSRIYFNEGPQELRQLHRSPSLSTHVDPTF